MEYVSAKAMLLSNQKFFRSNFLLLMRVHGLLFSLESCFNFSCFRVLIKYVLLWLQLITLKIHTKECFSVCYCRTPLSNNLSVLGTVCNFKSFVGAEGTVWVCVCVCTSCAWSVHAFVRLCMRCVRGHIGAGLCALTQSCKLIDYPSCRSLKGSSDEI